MSYFHTIRALSIALVVWFCRIHSLFAVEVNSGSGATFNTNDNIASIVSRWTSGWPASGIDGWSYVGSMNGASGVYLGNGWVLTAGHVGSGNFTLGGNTYNYAGYSYTGFTYTTNGTNYPVDLNLFQICTTSTTGNTITLPKITISTRSPSLNSQVVMIGYGGGNKAWGANNVGRTDLNVSVGGYPYESKDFETVYSIAQTNYAFFIDGDSGGATFLYTNSQWQLAGINEAVDPTTSNSYMVQLSSYATVISSVISRVPSALSYTPSTVSGMVGTPITSMFPIVNGTVSIYSVNPTLPLGLSLNTSSGVISGTPSVSSASSSYTITATNSYGWTTASVTIAIAAAPTPTPTPSPTPSATPTPTPSPTATPSPMPTASPSPAPAAPVSDEPTMPEWALILLAVLLAGYVLRATSRGTGHS